MTPAPRPLTKADEDQLVAILATQAANDMVSPQAFFKNLVRSANLPPDWILGLSGTWTGNPKYDARNLVGWAAAKGGNPADPRYTTLGSLLVALLPDLGIGESRRVVATLLAYNLCLDAAARSDLLLRYRVPGLAPAGVEAAGVSAAPPGLELEWVGPTDASELQAFRKSAPDLQDVGFLMRAMGRVSSVCRVELPTAGRVGTGVLIGDDLVLTNYHVLRWFEAESLAANAADVVLRFGVISKAGGQPAREHPFKLDAGQPVVSSSHVGQLDYVLLRAAETIAGVDDLSPTPVTLDLPAPGMGLHILQHPEGKEMQLGVSSDGVVSVLPARGLVQYLTQARAGSSGAPCFNDDWNLIALHHLERSRAFGTVREGIIFKAIHQEIQPYL